VPALKLSISRDIIVKQNGAAIEVAARHTEFRTILPRFAVFA
jgi:hypothetical protein